MNIDPSLIQAILDAVPPILDAFSKLSSGVGVFHLEFILSLMVLLLYVWKRK